MATIYQRGNSWYLNVFIDGKPVRRSLGENEELARLRLSEIESDRQRGKAGFPALARKRTLAQRLEEFLRDNVTGRAPGTVVRYREMAAHFLKFFGPDVDVDVAGLRRYIDHRLLKVRSKTVNNELIFLRMVYGPKGTHPFKAIPNLPTRDSKDLRVLDPDEAARLLAACATGQHRDSWPDLGDYVAAYLYTGVRLGELFALKWTDVLPEAIRVTNLKTFGKRRGDKHRLVPIHPELAPILARRRKARTPVPFPAHHHNSLRTAVQRAAARAGIEPGVGVHTLRHTFAGTLVSSGVDLYTVSKLLGHSSQETTRIYAHLSPAHLAGTVGRISYKVAEQ